MGFAESFIRGYTRGTQTKLEKEKSARDQAAFEADTKYREGQVKRQSEMDRLDAAHKGLAAKLELLKIRQSTDPQSTEQYDNPEKMGPPQTVAGQHPAIDFDLTAFGGGHESVVPEGASSIAAKAARQKVAEVQAEEEVRSKIKNRATTLTPEAARYLGTSATEVDPANLEVLKGAAVQRETNKRNREDNASADARARIMHPGTTGDDDQADYLADQISQRRLDYRSLTKDQKASVTASLQKRGMDIPRALTANEKDASKNAIQGIDALDRMDKMLAAHPRLAEAESFAPGMAGRLIGNMSGVPISEFRAAKQEAVDIVTRIRTGAALNATEQKYYPNLVAQSGDSPEAIATKHTQLRAFYLGVAGIPVKLTGPNGEEAVAQDMYDPKQRIGVRKMIDAGWKLEY